MSAYDAVAPRSSATARCLTACRRRSAPPSSPPSRRRRRGCSISAPAPDGIGRPFVAAGDDYVGVDLSLGMLREFARSAGTRPPLAQADGERLPFGDATFDAVLMVQVFGGMRGWRRVLAEARRVLRPHGALLIGRVVAPADGLDARMKQRLVELLGRTRRRDRAAQRPRGRRALARSASPRARAVTAATWSAERTPRRYLDRQRTGARFAALPDGRRRGGARTPSRAWAIATFGSLDAAVRETHAFELQIFTFAAREPRMHDIDLQGPC